MMRSWLATVDGSKDRVVVLARTPSYALDLAVAYFNRTSRSEPVKLENVDLDRIDVI